MQVKLIDCYNIQLSYLSAYRIKPLQYILKSAVRVVYNIPHCEKNNDKNITLFMTISSHESILILQSTTTHLATITTLLILFLPININNVICDYFGVFIKCIIILIKNYYFISID